MKEVSLSGDQGAYKTGEVPNEVGGGHTTIHIDDSDVESVTMGRGKASKFGAPKSHRTNGGKYRRVDGTINSEDLWIVKIRFDKDVCMALEAYNAD